MIAHSHSWRIQATFTAIRGEIRCGAVRVIRLPDVRRVA